MKLIHTFLFLFCSSFIYGQPVSNIIPQPLSIVVKDGQFVFPKKILIYSDANASSEALYLTNTLSVQNQITNNKQKANIILQTDSSKIAHQEGYILDISSKRIVITGRNTAGVFYGIQSFLQMIAVSPNALAGQTITDAPRFKWRAYMLDEARFFQGEKTVYMLLDEMAILKMNVFHWHLTDDAGWRIEIKKYPLLTQIGSKRTDSQNGGFNSKTTVGAPHSGFYTQEEIKRILQYAKERHIKVVPEIEMPGHASAAIASYPWLGSSDTPITVPVFFGKHYAIYNVANERVLGFLQDVISEVLELFQTDVIHIGGDEVRFDQWETNKEVIALKEKNKFTSFMDVQIDFTNKMSHFIDNKGVRMMGWNEILGKNLHAGEISFANPSQRIASNVIVQYWKGDLDGIVQAVINGYEIVNSHHEYTYLDYGYKSIPLKKAYNFEPLSPSIPANLQHKVIGLGCQCGASGHQTLMPWNYKPFLG